MENGENTSYEQQMKDRLPLGTEEAEEIAEEIKTLFEGNRESAAIESINHLHPSDQGRVIEELPPELQHEILTVLPHENAADILEHLDPENAVKVSERIDSAILSDILDEVDSDKQADIIRHLPDERAAQVLKEMKEASSVIPLLKYADDSAGGRMVLEFVAVRDDATAADAIDALRQQEPEVEDVHSIFVVDAEKRLVGELSLARLALSRPKTQVSRLMNTDLVFVTSETDQEESARVMERYSLNRLPVVDDNGHLVGVILSEDALEVVQEEATDDMYKLIGIRGERVFGPFRVSIKNRLPWLVINLMTTFLAALVINFFESTIARVVTLAVFLPVVAGQGGIGGTQTLTLIIRSMAIGDISTQTGAKLLRREILLGIMHGLFLGVIVGLTAYVWKGNYMLGFVLGTAMLGNMLIAGLTGAGVPLLLTKIGIDPATASAVVVTTCTDVFGFFLFLGMATALINYLY